MLLRNLFMVMLFLLNAFMLQAEKYLYTAHETDVLDSVINIQPVTIASDRLKQLGIGNNIEAIDSTAKISLQAATLSDLLSNETAIFIRSYGLGSLGTISIRGASSTQTAVLWNGFNIQSPMNALYDISLIPVFFLDEVQVQHGSSGALFGSGAVGGSIHLNSQVFFNKGLQAKYAANYGSFNAWMQGAAISFSNKKWFSQTKFFYKQAENNFRFKNIAEYGSPLQRLENAALQQWGIMHEQAFNFLKEKSAAKKNLLHIKYWQQKNSREIPPSMTMATSEALQKDAIIRGTVSWDYAIKKWETTLRTAYFNEQINFTDTTINLNEHYTAHTAIVESEHKIYLHKRHLLHGGINYTFHQSASKNYLGFSPTQNRGAAFASYRYTSANSKLVAVASIRKEIINNQRVPFTPSVASEYQVLHFLKLKSNVSRSFRVPSFNDWYWTQGGNPNLKAENGWSGETGFMFSKTTAHFSLNSEHTVFANTINERIIWLPNDIGIWTPENVSRVNARGIENSLKISYLVSHFSFSLNAKYSFVKATNSNKIANVNEAGKQLIYVPQHRANFQFSATYKNTTIQYIHLLNGETFYTSDNKRALPFYHVANIVISHQLKFKAHHAHLYFRINNAFNTSYQAIVWRPMPPINFETGIQLNINQKPIK